MRSSLPPAARHPPERDRGATRWVMVPAELPTPAEYAGQWVGLHDGAIVAASPDPRTLSLQITARNVPCVVYRVPDAAAGRPRPT